MATPVTLLRTERHQVDYFGNGGDVLVCTFSHWMPTTQPLDGLGFGTAFLLARGFDVVAFKAATNDWFCGLDVSAFDLPSKPRLGYGSSMGGYAAIKFADALKLERVLAISPQFDITQPWDRRWAKEAPPSFNPPTSCSAKVFVAFDPLVDSRHVEEIERIASVERIELPKAGHPAIYRLRDTGMLQPLVVSVLRNGHHDVGACVSM